MAYEPTVWKSGDTVTSAKLNKMEQGIANAGGGGGGVFIVNTDIETMTLGNTWQEIYNAGFAVVKVEPEEGYRQIYPVIETSPDGPNYKVSILTGQGAMNFVTNSPNGYPVISQ